MEIEDAAAMLAGIKSDEQSTWADLGCGSGTFTLGLASQLMPGSSIHAIDKDRKVLQKIPASFNQVSIHTMALDFAHEPLPLKELDGILMANSLHYVKDKPTFLRNVAACMSKDGSWLLVEYDTSAGNPWVPYPLSFANAKELFTGLGYKNIQRLSERSSVYGRAKMYAAYIQH